jgi:CRP/FNR family cyclic AMP-dependent transcriptional regulator
MAGPQSAVVSLLDLAPELGDGLPPEAWEEARRTALVRTTVLRPGRWRATTDGAAVLVLGGLVVRELHVGDRTASELVAAGDLIETSGAPHDLLPFVVDWFVVEEARIAMLGAATTRKLPSLVSANLVGLATARASRLATAQAIAQLPRVEDRIRAMFAQLAERWGRVTPHGVLVTLDLTHETIGTLVGAARPTVSIALKALAATGDVERAAGGWRISLEPLERLRPADTAGRPLPRAAVLDTRASPERSGRPAAGFASTPALIQDIAELRSRVGVLRTEHVRQQERMALARERSRALRWHDGGDDTTERRPGAPAKRR